MHLRAEGDVVVLDALDSYTELRTKVMVAMQWVQNNILAQFLLKTDDDCYINVAMLTKEVARLPRKLFLYFEKNGLLWLTSLTRGWTCDMSNNRLVRRLCNASYRHTSVLVG